MCALIRHLEGGERWWNHQAVATHCMCQFQDVKILCRHDICNVYMQMLRFHYQSDFLCSSPLEREQLGGIPEYALILLAQKYHI